MEVLTSPEPVTPPTQLTVMPWVMGVEGRRLCMPTEASLLKWKPYSQIKPNLDPLLHSTYERKWLTHPHSIFRCNGTRGGYSFRATNHLESPQESTERDTEGEFIHLTDGMGDGAPQRATTIYPLTWTSLIKDPIDRSVSWPYVYRTCCVLQVNMKLCCGQLYRMQWGCLRGRRNPIGF